MLPTTLLTLLPALASASISGIAVPATVAPGDSFRAIIQTQNFIQSVQDVAISFGLAPEADARPDALVNFLSNKYLGPDNSNISTNITHIVTVPEDMPQGPAVFTGMLFSLLGAVYSPNEQTFTVDVTVGDFTDEANYASSTSS